MPNYAPQDMAYLLKVSKPSGKMTQEEMALAQSIGEAVAPLGAMPVDMPQVTPQNAMGTPAPMPQVNPQSPMGQPVPMPVNRLAALQAAANQQLAGQGDAANPNMANIAKYFQGRQ
jgi:hypothetical protein